MKKTYDVHVEAFIPLVSPNEMNREIPMTEKASDTVLIARQQIGRILKREDKRLVVVVGPGSIHDESAALEYATRLNDLKAQVEETMCLVMRVYFEKPRTATGWKGIINDPCLDGSCDMDKGLHNARSLLLKITEMGIPTATEMLDPIIPQYIAGLVCWTAIGARTTESQTHREMASGLSMPVGFKNCTDGELDTALNAMLAAGSPQSFLGIDEGSHLHCKNNRQSVDTRCFARRQTPQLRFGQHLRSAGHAKRQGAARGRHGRLLSCKFKKEASGPGGCMERCHQSTAGRKRRPGRAHARKQSV